jgi:hypothetical protein
MGVRDRQERLEKILPPPPTPEERRRWGAVCNRFIPLLGQSFPLESQAEYGLVEAAFLEWADHGRGPVAQWLDDLREGHCRIPEIIAETIRQLALCWLHPDVGDALVRNRRGLECPRSPDRHPGRRNEPDRARLAEPRYFEVCPGCGADKRDVDWPHLVEGKSPRWTAGWASGGERC